MQDIIEEGQRISELEDDMTNGLADTVHQEQPASFVVLLQRGVFMHDSAIDLALLSAIVASVLPLPGCINPQQLPGPILLTPVPSLHGAISSYYGIPSHSIQCSDCLPLGSSTASASPQRPG
jgi:hypothetical protein